MKTRFSLQGGPCLQAALPARTHFNFLAYIRVHVEITKAASDFQISRHAEGQQIQDGNHGHQLTSKDLPLF